MCIIAVKFRGNKFPTERELENCFEGNSHGAGVAWNDGSLVHWHKGFMSWEEFNAFDKKAPYRDMDCDVMYHFRISTSGGIRPDVTHPFPICRDDTLLYATEGAVTIPVLAHNGILSVKERDERTSDTQQFILDVLAEPLILQGVIDEAPGVLNVLKMAASSSKLAIMTPEKVVIINKNLGTEHNDNWYSNGGFNDHLYGSYGYGNWRSQYGYGDEWDTRHYTETDFDDALLKSHPTKVLSLENDGWVSIGETRMSRQLFLTTREESLFQNASISKTPSTLRICANGMVTFSYGEDAPTYTYSSPHYTAQFDTMDLDVMNAMVRQEGALLYFESGTDVMVKILAQADSKLKVIYYAGVDDKDEATCSTTLYDWEHPAEEQLA